MSNTGVRRVGLLSIRSFGFGEDSWGVEEQESNESLSQPMTVETNVVIVCRDQNPGLGGTRSHVFTVSVFVFVFEQI